MEKITLTIDKEVLKPIIYQIFDDKMLNDDLWAELPEVKKAYDAAYTYFKKVCGVPYMQTEAEGLFTDLQYWAAFEGFFYGFIAAGGGSAQPTEKSKEDQGGL